MRHILKRLIGGLALVAVTAMGVGDVWAPRPRACGWGSTRS